MCYLLLFGTKYVYKKCLDSENASNFFSDKSAFQAEAQIACSLVFRVRRRSVWKSGGEWREKKKEKNMFFNADIYEEFRNSVAFSLPCLKLILIYTKG